MTSRGLSGLPYGVVVVITFNGVVGANCPPVIAYMKFVFMITNISIFFLAAWIK